MAEGLTGGLKGLAMTLIAAAALATTPAPATAGAAPDGKPRNDCFLTGSWQGWSAPGDGDVLYLRITMHDIYRVDLTPGSHVHRSPDRFLVNRVRGSNWICSALDLDLTLSDAHGIRQPLIARSLRKLTPDEIAAIPRKDLPG
jgi:hypothetical protein